MDSCQRTVERQLWLAKLAAPQRQALVIEYRLFSRRYHAGVRSNSRIGWRWLSWQCFHTKVTRSAPLCARHSIWGKLPRASDIFGSRHPLRFIRQRRSTARIPRAWIRARGSVSPSAYTCCDELQSPRRWKIHGYQLEELLCQLLLDGVLRECLRKLGASSLCSKRSSG